MKVGPYEIESELGRGGMGIVFRAKDPDGRPVALKMLKKLTEEGAARFEREVRLLGSFTAADGFVPLLDSGRAEQGPYMVMPLLGGGTLRARLRGQPLPLAQVRGLGNALAAALANAHARKIIHRDLKPENILYTSEGVPLVADLGLAKHYSRDSSGVGLSMALSKAGARGTIGYMAPEQYDDARTAGPEADVFAIGAILYECLSGLPAFPGESVSHVIRAVCEGRRTHLSALVPEAPTALVAAIERALDHSSAKRFKDAGELGAALREGAAPPKRKGGRRRGTRHDSAAEVADDDDDDDEAPRSRAPLVVGVAAGLLLLGGGGLFLATRSAPPPPPAPPPKTTPAPPPPAPAPRPAPPPLPPAPLLPPPPPFFPPPPPMPQRSEVDDLNRRSCDLRERGDLQGAIEAASRAIELDPKSSFAWQCRGNAKLGLRDFEGALADLDRAVDVDPNDWRAWGSRGTIRVGAGQVDDAEKDFEKSVAMEPRSYEGWQQLGMISLRRGQTQRALEQLDKAVALNPAADIVATRAIARRRAGDGTGALADAKDALSKNPAPILRANLEKFIAELEPLKKGR